MPVFRGKTYTIDPTCIYCGQPTEQTVMTRTSNRRRTFSAASNVLEVPAHLACHTRRGVIMAVGAVVALLVGGLVIAPLGAKYLGELGGLLALLVGVLGLPWLALYLLSEWVVGPARRFVQKHGLEEDELV